MTRSIKIVLIFICMFFAGETKADSWTDPTWKRMLDLSETIALVQYTGDGDFKASAKILKIYKGHLKAGDEIWISGFSNRYGPIDKMTKGDQYIVFLYFSSYNVWSPTSGDLKVNGDKVQYDLIKTTFYKKQQYYSLSAFEEFLVAYNDRSKVADLCKKLLSKIKPAAESELHTQQLMQLFLLGYDQYDTIFEDYVKINNVSSKYALAQLMGNIRSAASRNILIALLDDKNSFVQGETVRQLKNEPAEIVSPILLKHLNTSGEANFGPSNVMDPVRNSIDGGKIEIIKTLGILQYQPAVPDLLLLLDTENDDLFTLVIDALKNIGSKAYIPYINKHLNKKTNRLIFPISMMIAKDSLLECLPSFKNFISTCDRNIHPSYEFTISTCCGIGHFKDTATTAFLLADYKRFFDQKENIESSKQKYWTKSYIETFADLKTKEARPLIYRSIYDWSGVNEDFGKHPMLFKLKKQIEDSIRTVFVNGLQKKGYKLNYCIAFIENSAEVIAGKKPTVKYLIEVTIPSTDKGDEHKEIITKELNIPKESVYTRFNNGIYYAGIQERFNKSIFSTPISYFLPYAEAIPNPSDLVFLQGLLENNFVTEEYYQKKIRETIEEIKNSLNK